MMLKHEIWRAQQASEDEAWSQTVCRKDFWTRCFLPNQCMTGVDT